MCSESLLFVFKTIRYICDTKHVNAALFSSENVCACMYVCVCLSECVCEKERQKGAALENQGLIK